MDEGVRKKRVFKDFIQNDSPDEDAGCSHGAHDKIRKDKANPSYTSTQRTSLPEPPKKLKRINNPSPLTPPCTSSQRNSMPEPAKKNQIKNPSPPIRHAASTRKTLPEPPKKLQRNKPSPPTPTSQTPEPWSMDLFMPPPKLKTQASQLSPPPSPTMGSADNTWIPDLTSTPCTPKTVKGRKNLQRRLLTSSPSAATTSTSQTEFSQTTNRSPRTDLMQYRLAVQKKKSTTKDLHQLKPSPLHRQSPTGGMACGVTCIWLPGHLTERRGTTVLTLFKPQGSTGEVMKSSMWLQIIRLPTPALQEKTKRPVSTAPEIFLSQARDTEVQKKSPRGKTASKSVFPMSTAKFQRVVIGKLVDLTEEVKGLRGAMEPEGLPREVKQLNTLEELEDLEASLRNPKERASLVQAMAKVGGKSIKDNTNKIMDRLLTNKLMATFNMKGGGPRNKRPFRETTLYSVIKDAVIRSNPSATEAQVDGSMADHLKQAPGRTGGGALNEQPVEALRF